MAEEGYAQEEMTEASSGEEQGRKPAEEGDEGAPAWMVTFADLMSLLLCFFVLIVSFSSMDVIRYRSLVGSLRSAFGSQNTIQSRVIQSKTTAVSLGANLPGNQSLSWEEMENDLVAAVEEEGLTGEATLHRTDNGMVLRVRGTVMFEPGGTRILPESLSLLDKVAQVARSFPRAIYVEGHTDNIPLHSEAFPSNWELSSGRASAVVRYLTEIQHVAPEKLVASGFAHTVPLATNTTAAGRALNRRVEFVFSGRPGDTI